MFLKLHRELRLIKPLTFPVTTMCLLHDGEKYLDPAYRELCASEWSKGSWHFLFTNNNPSAIASCCRVLNEIADNTFSSTNGLTGVMTGSCNVITLNLNRIVQEADRKWGALSEDERKSRAYYEDCLVPYLKSVLERVYKYHIAYKTMLYEWEENGMYAFSNGGYCYIKKLFSTIGEIGYFEAAKFLGIKPGFNEEYIEFLQVIFGTIKEENAKHSIHDAKRPFIFNSEAVPGESLASKFYEADKEDGFWVPEDQILYNSYFYSPWDDTDMLTKLKLHGKNVAPFLDGGQACHLNLYSWPSEIQCEKLMDDAIEFGTSYFTINVPQTECKDCKHTFNAPLEECPNCHSHNVRYWTRIIGYPTCVDNWPLPRMKEFYDRMFGDKTIKEPES